MSHFLTASLIFAPPILQRNLGSLDLKYSTWVMLIEKKKSRRNLKWSRKEGPNLIMKILFISLGKLSKANFGDSQRSFKLEMTKKKFLNWKNWVLNIFLVIYYLDFYLTQNYFFFSLFKKEIKTFFCSILLSKDYATKITEFIIIFLHQRSNFSSRRRQKHVRTYCLLVTCFCQKKLLTL